MDQIPLDSIDTSEFRGPEVQTAPLSSPGWPSAQSTDSLSELFLETIVPQSLIPNFRAAWRSIHHSSEVQTAPDGPSDQSIQADSSEKSLSELFLEIIAFICQLIFSNFMALAWRFIQLFCRPDHLASLVIDLWPLTMSFMWTPRQSGPDLLYPLSSLKKHKSGRLAKLLLEHSRYLQLQNLHVAASPRGGVDPPCVAVIDLHEVPPEIIERGYTVSADFFGFVVLVTFFEILLAPIVHIFFPADLSPLYESLYEDLTQVFSDQVAAWIDFLVRLVLSGNTPQWLYLIIVILGLCAYAVIHGESTLTLVRRSDLSTPGCAVLLDRDFTVILTGTQDVVEAIAERSFSMSHTLPRRFQLIGWQFGQRLCYEILKACCQGVPFTMLAGFWLLLRPTSPQMALLPFIPIFIMCFARVGTDAVRILIQMYQQQDINFYRFLKTVIIGALRSYVSAIPALVLVFTYVLAMGLESPSEYFNPPFPALWFFSFPVLFIIILSMSSRNYHIRTAKFLDILGSPPVRRWEFDTLASAATFQCLVVCR
ncbi:hypothetical protein OG21DRAFT_1506191, partial [Imleria badia]